VSLVLFVLVGWSIVGTLVMCCLVVLLKRSAVRAWRRWQVSLESERCDLAHEPSFCGRQQT